MKIISKPRAGGKTTALVNRAKKTGGIIITFSAYEADRICDQFGMKRDQVMTWNEAAAGKARATTPGKERPVYVDNADMILTGTIGRSIEFISITKEWP